MGNINNTLRRLPNSEAWIDPDAVVAVARMADSTVKSSDDGNITMLNFSIRLSDGKAINFQHHDRQAISDFLKSIGVIWDA